MHNMARENALIKIDRPGPKDREIPGPDLVFLGERERMLFGTTTTAPGYNAHVLRRVRPNKLPFKYEDRNLQIQGPWWFLLLRLSR